MVKNSEGHLKVVQSAYAAVGQGDITTYLSYLSEDVIWETPFPRKSVPIGGSWYGKEEVGEFFKILLTSLEIQQFEPRDYMVSGDKVVVIGYVQAVVKATKLRFEISWVHIFTLEHGKIKQFQEFTDTAAVIDAYRNSFAKPTPS